jgi:hypothetical protein
MRAQYQLYRSFSAAMYNIAMRLVNNKMDAEDILQESFASAGNVKLDSYSDKFAIAAMGDLEFENKYSSLNTGKAGNVKVDAYSSTMVIAGMKDVRITSKYGKYEFGKAGSMVINSSYSDNLKIKELVSLGVKTSKYGVFRVESLDRDLNMVDSYSEKIYISGTGSDFKGFSLDGKYMKAEISLDPALAYHFKADVQYPNLTIPEEEMNVRSKIKESSNLKMEATKGSVSESSPTFELKGYNMRLELKEDR